MKQNNAVFITGGTGVIGSYLTTFLLSKGIPVFVLVRDGKLTPRNRMAEKINFWSTDIFKKFSKNLIVLKGDIRENNLGLTFEHQKMLKNNVTKIYHCAADTKFNEKIEILRKTNVFGTMNIFDFVIKTWPALNRPKINHLSTIFVCGNHSGIFTESDLYLKQAFNTGYEQSKFEAEELVASYRKQKLSISIFRPPAIAGDSKTGRISSLTQAPYQALRIISKELLPALPVDKKQILPVVCIDELCKSIVLLSNIKESTNRTFHVFSNRQLPTIKWIEFITRSLNIKPSKIVDKKFLLTGYFSAAQKILIKNNFNFLNSDVKFNCKYTNSLLAKHGFCYSAWNQTIILRLFTFAFTEGFVKKGYSTLNPNEY